MNVAGFQQFRRSDSRSSNPARKARRCARSAATPRSRALVLLDEVPYARSVLRLRPFSAIAPERHREHPRDRGGGSGPFGAGALAGAIELEAPTPRRSACSAARPRSTTAAKTETVRQRWRRSSATGLAVVSGRWDRGQGFCTTPREPARAGERRARGSTPGRPARGWCSRSARDIEVQVRGHGVRERPHACALRKAPTPRREGQDVSAARWSAAAPWQVDVLAYWPVAQLLEHRDLLDHFHHDARPAGHAGERPRRQGRSAPADRRRAYAAVRVPTSATPTGTSPNTVQRRHRRPQRQPLCRRGQLRSRASSSRTTVRSARCC